MKKGDRIRVAYTAIIGKRTARKQAINDLQRWWAEQGGAHDIVKRGRLQALLGQEPHEDVDNNFCRDMLHFIGCEGVQVESKDLVA